MWAKYTCPEGVTATDSGFPSHPALMPKVDPVPKTFVDATTVLPPAVSENKVLLAGTRLTLSFCKTSISPDSFIMKSIPPNSSLRSLKLAVARLNDEYLTLFDSGELKSEYVIVASLITALAPGRYALGLPMKELSPSTRSDAVIDSAVTGLNLGVEGLAPAAAPSGVSSIRFTKPVLEMSNSCGFSLPLAYGLMFIAMGLHHTSP